MFQAMIKTRKKWRYKERKNSKEFIVTGRERKGENGRKMRKVEGGGIQDKKAEQRMKRKEYIRIKGE